MRRLYPELYKKRQQELNSAKSKKERNEALPFKDNKGYETWKSSHPLNMEAKMLLQQDKRLAEAQLGVENAGVDPIAKSMAQRKFQELEYKIWQELYDKQVTGALQKLK